jgi:hypothetical protein
LKKPLKIAKKFKKKRKEMIVFKIGWSASMEKPNFAALKGQKV